MGRDDWKYDEEVWEASEKEDEEAAHREVQCPRCLHWLPLEAAFCSWCGKVLGEGRKG